MNLFKKLAFCAMLLCASVNAGEKTYVKNEKTSVSCSVLLENHEYIRKNGKLYVNDSVMQEIYKEIPKIYDFQCWEMLDFHVFIYVECPYCHAAHLIDFACPNCKNGQQI